MPATLLKNVINNHFRQCNLALLYIIFLLRLLTDHVHVTRGLLFGAAVWGLLSLSMICFSFKGGHVCSFSLAKFAAAYSFVTGNTAKARKMNLGVRVVFNIYFACFAFPFLPLAEGAWG